MIRFETARVPRTFMLRLLLIACLCWWLAPAAPAEAQDFPLSNCKTSEMRRLGQGFAANKAGHFTGGVEFVCDDTQVFADEIEWDEKTLRARGRILVVQDGLRVTAERVDMDRATRLGTFYNAAGTARLTERPVQGSQFGTLEPEVSFEAAKLEKIGPRTYRLTDGSFTTCVQANRRWDVHGSSGTVTLDERVLLRNAVLRVKGVPVVYLPVIYYPLGEDDRSSGFLLPTYSNSSVRGHGVSNAFFWAIGRSHDATLYHDWYSAFGQIAAGEYRFISSPGSQGEVRAKMVDERERLNLDGTIQRPKKRSYDVYGTINQSLRGNFRFIGNANYATDITTLQLYQQNVFDLSRRDRHFSGALSGGRGRYRLQALVERRDIFTDATTAQRRGRLPQVNLWISEQRIGRSRISFGLSGELAGIQNQTDISQSSTNTSLWRFDAAPTVRAPLSNLDFLSVVAATSWRLTHWTDSLDPLTGTPRAKGITRPLAEVRADVTGPVFARVFQTPKNGYAERFKHVIEPRVSVQWFSAFDRFNEVVRNDPGIDSLVGGNTTLTYSLFNRLFARRRQQGGTGRVLQMFWVSVSQSYYTETRAGAFDTQYLTATAGRFSPVQISAEATPTDGLSGRFQMYLDSRTRAVQSYSASARAFGRRTQVQASWSKRQYLPDVPGFDNPLSASHFLNASASLRSSDGRVGGTYGFFLDVRQKSFLEQRFSAFYGAQCCGVSVDYQIMNVSHLSTSVRKDHRFNFSVTLAGIGSFSNPLGSFGR